MSSFKIAQIDVTGSATASMVFSSIPYIYTDLILVASLRDSNSGTTSSACYVTLNSDVGANYVDRYFYGNGTTATGVTGAADTGFYPLRINANGDTANTFGCATVYIPNYTSSVAKVVMSDSVEENNSATGFTVLQAGNWSGTAPITTVSLVGLATYQFQVGSSATLYGILKGTSGGTLVA